MNGRQGTVALIHVREARPHAMSYQRLADRLNEQAIDVLTAAGWRTRLHAAGDAPIADTLAVARDADLVIIMGGEDVHPSYYGGDFDYPRGGSHDLRADDAQLTVVHDALDRGTPLLGICRGHQIINVALGGDLIQHLPQDGTHRVEPANGTKRDSFTPHDIVVTDERWGAAIDLSSPVQSSHHQAVGRRGAGLVEVARAHDCVNEAIGHESAPILGVQWHPEHPAAPAGQLTRLARHLAGADLLAA